MNDDHHDDPALDRVERLLRAAGPPPEPSAALRARLLEIPRQETRPARARGLKGFWTSLTAWRVASGALALAAVVLAVVAVTRDGGSTAVNGQRIALTSSSEYRATASAVSLVSDGTRQIRVRIDGLPQLEGSQVYELWIAKDRKHRVSIGIFRPNAQGSIDTTLSIPNLGPHWRGLWLTHEQGSGAARLVARLGRRGPPRLTRISAGARCRPRSGSANVPRPSGRAADEGARRIDRSRAFGSRGRAHLADRRDPLGGGVGVERRRDGRSGPASRRSKRESAASTARHVP